MPKIKKRTEWQQRGLKVLTLAPPGNISAQETRVPPQGDLKETDYLA